MLREVLAFSFAVGCLSGCAAAEPAVLTDDERRSVEAEVRRSWDEMAQAILRGEIEVALRFLDDAEPVHAVDGHFHRGVPDVTQAYHTGLGPVASFLGFSVEAEDLQVLSHDAASLAFSFNEQFVTTAGDTLGLVGVWLQVWRRGSAGWRLMHSSASHRAASGN